MIAFSEDLGTAWQIGFLSLGVQGVWQDNIILCKDAKTYIGKWLHSKMVNVYTQNLDKF